MKQSEKLPQSSYAIEWSSIEQNEKKEFEQEPNVPIIDIVRHGETDYKELIDSGFEYTIDHPAIPLDVEHLDLNEEGIATIQETARTIESISDKDNEVIMLITSPGYRADSSLRIIEDHLVNQGFAILNPEDQKMVISNINQLTFQDKGDIPKWFEAHKKVNETESTDGMPPNKVHAKMADVMGSSIKDIFGETYDDVDKRFDRFLRHMTNIYRWFGEETRDNLEGKRLRMICLTHEEVPDLFMEQSLHSDQNLSKGQILEIKPEQQIMSNETIDMNVTLYPQKEESGLQSTATFNFTPISNQ